MALFCLTADQAQWPLYDLRSKDRMSDEVCPVFGRSARSPSHRTRSAVRFVPLRFLLPARLATRGVRDRDRTKVITMRPGSTIDTVVHRMRLERIGAVIISPDGNSIVGVLSERDILRALAEHATDLLRLKVEDL